MTRVVPNLRHVGNEALQRLLVVGMPAEAVYEFPFSQAHKWRFDVAFPDKRVAVEFQGGVWTAGRHTRGAGYIEDCWKLDHAVVYGWKVLWFTPDMLRHNLARCREMLSLVLSQETLPGREEEVGK